MNTYGHRRKFKRGRAEEPMRYLTVYVPERHIYWLGNRNKSEYVRMLIEEKIKQSGGMRSEMAS